MQFSSSLTILGLSCLAQALPSSLEPRLNTDAVAEFRFVNSSNIKRELLVTAKRDLPHLKKGSQFSWETEFNITSYDGGYTHIFLAQLYWNPNNRASVTVNQTKTSIDHDTGDSIQAHVSAFFGRALDHGLIASIDLSFTELITKNDSKTLGSPIVWAQLNDQDGVRLATQDDLTITWDKPTSHS